MDGNGKSDDVQEINKNTPNEDKIKCMEEEKIRQNDKMNSDEVKMQLEEDKNRDNENMCSTIDKMQPDGETNKISEIMLSEFGETQQEEKEKVRLSEKFYSEVNQMKYEQEKTRRNESMKTENEKIEAAKNLANKQGDFADMDPEIRYNGSDSSRSPGREDIIDGDSSGSSDGEEDVDSGIAEEPPQVRRPFDCYDLANFFSYW